MRRWLPEKSDKKPLVASGLMATPEPIPPNPQVQDPWLRAVLLITEPVCFGAEAVVPESWRKLRCTRNEVRTAVRGEIGRMGTIWRVIAPTVTMSRPHSDARRAAAKP